MLTGLLALFLLAGCASYPTVTQGPGSDAREAGRVVLQASADGPIPLIVDRPPRVDGTPVNADELAGWATQGLSSWTSATVTPSSGTTEGKRLVYRFTTLHAFSPNDACRDPKGGPIGEATTPPTLQAYLCEGAQAVANTRATATGADRDALQRLVIATTRRLVPNTRMSGPSGMGLFGGVGIGSSGRTGGGLGIGLGF